MATNRACKFGFYTTFELDVAAQDMFVFVTFQASATLVGLFVDAALTDAQQIAYILLGVFLFYKRNGC